MSYSFSVRAANRSDVMEKITAELDAVVAGQPQHAKDRDAALASAKSFVEMLPESSEGKEISVSMHGSLGWQHDAPDVITGSGVGISTSLVPAAAAEGDGTAAA